MICKLAALLFASLAIASCAATTPYNPFKIPRADIHARVKTIALVPIEIAPEVEDPAGIKRKFEALMAAKLRSGGFGVVGSEEYAKIWKASVEKLGAVFDAASGKRDDRKFNAVFEHTVRELRAKTQADALLLSAVGSVSADFSSNLAEWHGVIDYVRPEGVWATFSGPQAYGTVPALSLWINLMDVQGTEMYVNFGGIQVVSKVVTGMKVIEIPRADLLADEAKNVRAVNVAINPLIGQPPPQAR